MFRVKYFVTSFGVYYTPPYDNLNEALANQKDIMGYEGVEWTKIVDGDKTDEVSLDIQKVFLRQ